MSFTSVDIRPNPKQNSRIRPGEMRKNELPEFVSAEAQKSATEIQEWLLSYLSELLEIDAEEIDINDSFASYGLDSSAAVGMVGDLADWLNRNLDAELI